MQNLHKFKWRSDMGLFIAIICFIFVGVIIAGLLYKPKQPYDLSKYQTADMYFSRHDKYDTDKETIEFLNGWYELVLLQMDSIDFMDYKYDMIKKMFGYVWNYEHKFSPELIELIDGLYNQCCERVDNVVLGVTQ